MYTKTINLSLNAYKEEHMDKSTMYFTLKDKSLNNKRNLNLLFRIVLLLKYQNQLTNQKFLII